MINGVTDLIMMKSDVLSHLDTIKIATAYKIDGKLVDHFPYDLSGEVEPVYTEMPGWKCDLTGVRSEEKFPAELKGYISFLEKELGVPITIVSVGPDRTQTIVRKS